jgi:hypothetical protein
MRADDVGTFLDHCQERLLVMIECAMGKSIKRVEGVAPALREAAAGINELEAE